MYICSICNKEFKTEYSYNSHLTFHKNQEKYPTGIDCPICNHHSKSLKGLYRHCSLEHSNQEQELVYRNINSDKEVHLCEECQKPAIFLNTSKGFANYCSEECKSIIYKKHHLEGMSNVDYSKLDWNSITEKRRKTSDKNWGYDNPAKSPIVKEITRLKCQEIYGSDNPMGNKNVQEKAKKHNIEEYGYEWHLSSPEIIQKRIDNLREKYRVENVFQLENVKEKIRETNLITLGCENPSQNKDIQLKKIETSKEKYGVEHPSQTSWFQEKRKHTCIRKYNVDHFSKTDLFKAKFKETSLKNWGVDNPNKSEKVREKTKETNNRLYGGDICFADRSIAEKRKNTWNKNGYSNPYQSKNTREIVLYNQYTRTINRYKKDVIPMFSYEEWKFRKEDRLQWRCTKCNSIFVGYPYCGNAPRCLHCYPLMAGFSNMEKQVVDFVSKYNIDIIENTRTIIKPLELDMYIPSLKLAIEFDGLYWHSEQNNIGSDYHLTKTEMCNAQNIQLIHIFENEWLNKEDIVKSIILSKAGIYTEKIGARECELRNVASKEASIFYNENHIQGSINSSINIGLYYNNVLVSCLSFSKPRFNKKYNWEITRFANKLNWSVAGSFSRLWKHKPDGSIITYSDKRYFNGNIYKKYMNQLEDSKPSYYYVVDGNLENRVKYQKHKLKELLEVFDSNLTEVENMHNNGFYRIWDCGNAVFEYIP